MFKPLFMAALAPLAIAAAGPAPMGPREAIVAAADAAPRVVPGVFAMRVTATGRVGPRIYLNSEADYRDQRNLTIAIEPWAAQQLARRYRGAPEPALRGHTIEVRGAARRQRIDFMNNFHRPTGLYYYQTHVRVTNADQIRIVD
ncbi:MAG TPA: hypothetical protein VK614_03365 [Allosphingosinicella sp.]|nr:hypothetical protein [Allosphingosinicella sp.]